MAIKVGEKTKAERRRRLDARKNELEKEKLVIEAKIALIDAQLHKIGEE